jgi:hypothetical protein
MKDEGPERRRLEDRKVIGNAGKDQEENDGQEVNGGRRDEKNGHEMKGREEDSDCILTVH